MIGALARQRYLEAFDDPITVNEADGETVFVEDPEGNAYNLSGLTDEDVLDKIERSRILILSLRQQAALRKGRGFCIPVFISFFRQT